MENGTCSRFCILSRQFLPQRYALGSLLQGQAGRPFEPGKVVGKASEGSARTVSEFCFQHTALFVGDIT